MLFPTVTICVWAFAKFCKLETPASVFTEAILFPTKSTFVIAPATVSISEVASFKSSATVTTSETASAKSSATATTFEILVATVLTEPIEPATKFIFVEFELTLLILLELELTFVIAVMFDCSVVKAVLLAVDYQVFSK